MNDCPDDGSRCIREMADDFAAAEAAGGGIVTFPAGVWHCHEPLQLDPGVVIQGPRRD